MVDPQGQDGPPQDGPPKVLLVGYNGANNTGSESRLLSIIDEVRSVLGDDVHITIPTLNPVNLCRYIDEGPNITVAPIPSIYFNALSRLVKENELVLLVEGSCYMDTWTTALLWAFLWASKQAARRGRPCMAYAVDAGHLSRGNMKRVRREASKTDLIVLRTQAAAERMREWGVKAPIEVTADTTFTFRMDPADEGILGRLWPEASGPVAGISPVDFYSWPVVVRLFGRSEDCYRWPYYFSRNAERRSLTRDLAKGLAKQADRMVERHGMDVALVCMEELDEPIARMIEGKMKHGDHARVFSSCDHNASEMMGILTGLDFLISSRYHACVMAMAAGVPMVAVAHDMRLKDLFADMGLIDTHLIDYTEAAFLDRMRKKVRLVMADPESTRRTVERSHREHEDRARRNRELLADFVKQRGWSVRG
jgi:polysaccharide pyruvyl transferase WcaK-like protein